MFVLILTLILLFPFFNKILVNSIGFKIVYAWSNRIYIGVNCTKILIERGPVIIEIVNNNTINHKIVDIWN